MDRIRQLLEQSVLSMSIVMVAGACSVKEERSDCPCYLAIDTESFYSAGMRNATVDVSTESSLVSRESIEIGLFTDEPYYVEVPRRMNYVSMVGGFGNGCFLDGDTLRVKEGMISDPVMAFFGDIACLGDDAEIRPQPHKQFCRVTIMVVGKAQGEDYPYRYRVDYPCNALNIKTLVPVEGRGSFVVEENLQASMEFILLRQQGVDIRMDVLMKGSDGSGPREQIASINLGALLARKNYDWTKADLDDVVLTIDYSKASVSIDIEPWTDVFLVYDS